jgi:hypothetical protein
LRRLDADYDEGAMADHDFVIGLITIAFAEPDFITIGKAQHELVDGHFYSP